MVYPSGNLRSANSNVNTLFKKRDSLENQDQKSKTQSCRTDISVRYTKIIGWSSCEFV
jgi:hypothetical protein